VIITLCIPSINLCSGESLKRTKEYTISNVKYRMDLFEDLLTWQEAFDKCRINDTELAVLDNEELMDEMTGFFESEINDQRDLYHVWIAGKRRSFVDSYYLNGSKYTGNKHLAGKYSHVCVLLVDLPQR
jgi:hypothetical protein